MRYSKIFIWFLLLPLIDRASSKSNIRNNGIVVDSSGVTDRSDFENANTTTAASVVTTTIEDITTQEPRNNSIPKTCHPEGAKVRPKKIFRGIDDDPNYVKGEFGGYYFNCDIKERTKYYYFHGKYQKPSLHYYGSYKHQLEDNSTLGYYLGFSISKMNHNEYFEHHHYKSFKAHHYFFRKNTMLPEQFVSSDFLLHCAKNTSMFCPENTEAICLQNTTVWCGTQISHVEPCVMFNDSTECVSTRIPCVKNDDPNCKNSVEIRVMPCIAKIKILDPLKDKNGLTLVSVAGTFILSPARPIEESTYCVTIVAEPSKD